MRHKSISAAFKGSSSHCSKNQLDFIPELLKTFDIAEVHQRLSRPSEIEFASKLVSLANDTNIVEYRYYDIDGYMMDNTIRRSRVIWIHEHDNINELLLNNTQLLVAFPDNNERYGDVWALINKAISKRKDLVIVNPDGSRVVYGYTIIN